MQNRLEHTMLPENRVVLAKQFNYIAFKLLLILVNPIKHFVKNILRKELTDPISEYIDHLTLSL